MSTIIVLFNLKPGADVDAYERWARTTDLPIVNALPSIERFEVLKTTGLLTGGTAPYEYVEVLRVRDMTQLGADVATEAMQRVAAEFNTFADNPLFITTTAL